MASTKIMSKMVKKAITSHVGPLHRTSESRATTAMSSFSAPKKRSSLNMLETSSSCSQPATASLFSLLQQQQAEEATSGTTNMSSTSNKRFKRSGSGPSFEVTDLFSGLLGDHEADFPSIGWDLGPEEEKKMTAVSTSNFALLPRARSGGLIRSKAFTTSSQTRLFV